MADVWAHSWTVRGFREFSPRERGVGDTFWGQMGSVRSDTNPYADTIWGQDS